MLLLRFCFCCLALLFVNLPLRAAEEPPYAPLVASGMLTKYVNSELAFTLAYPSEFAPQTPEDLAAVMDRGHRAAFGTAPENDPDHQNALKCMRTLFYATDAPATASATVASTQPVESAASILIVDFARSCVPKDAKGDKALSVLTGSVLHLPGASQAVPQTWFVAGGKRRIHSGMSATVLTAGGDKQSALSSPAKQATLFILAASFEQKEHLLLVAYLRGTGQASHEAVRNMAVSFEGGREILIYPFLMGRMHVTR